MATTRNQPQYDFITGATTAPSRPPSRQGNFRASQAPRADNDNEELRAQIHKLQYEVESLKQEREATTLRHEEELRRTQSKADADFKRAQVLETSSNTASKKQEALAQELEEVREELVRDRADWERRLRTAHDQHDVTKEELEDVQSAYSAQERQLNHKISELMAKLQNLDENHRHETETSTERGEALELARRQIEQQQEQIGSLENEIIRLKTQTDDADTLATIKRELSEQVAHIQKLEATNIDQSIELKQLHQRQKAVEVVEEEKRTLERKVEMMNEMRKELSEVHLQKQILEDERNAWSAYLENSSPEEEDLKFERPEDLAKAYIQERLERASIVNKLGQIMPELKVKEEVIQSLENDRFQLQKEVETLRIASESAAGPDAKAKARLERQRALAVKEVDYLRAQLEAFDMEKNEFAPEQYDAEKSKRIQELEGLVDTYRAEIQTLHSDLSKFEEDKHKPDTPKSPSIGSKRSRDSLGLEDERIGEYSRKNRALQDTISELQTAKTLLEKELSVQKAQLKSAKARSATRILELRANPTAEVEAIKLDTLNKLRTENTALLAQLEQHQQAADASSGKARSSRSASGSKATALDTSAFVHRTVPYASLERLRSDMDAKDSQIASNEKHLMRLKQIFGTKSLEFREAVASILGWKLDILPNGRVRVTSMFYPGDKDASTGEEGNSIVFDGENGTMKVSGGPQSAFAGEIRSLIEFWVEGRKEIPCFLAACTLEFWEKSTRAAI